jgi:hypothetical protein
MTVELSVGLCASGMPLCPSLHKTKIINPQDYWVFGLCPSSGVLKNTTFRKLDVFPTSGEGWGTPGLLDPLERANLDHWTTYVSLTSALCTPEIRFRIR